MTLARAIYSAAEVILLDDVLAALDVHTARWIIKKCFQGDLVQGRTVLLVVSGHIHPSVLFAKLEQTHNVAMALPTAGYVVTLSSDGRVASHGPVQEVLDKDAELQKELEESEATDEKADEVVDAKAEEQPKKKGDGKLVVAEEIAEGHVGWPASK